jgi:hypothetical protein
MRAEPERLQKVRPQQGDVMAGSTIDLDETATPEILDPRDCRWPRTDSRAMVFCHSVWEAGYFGEGAMQYLVEAARGPLPSSPEQAIALLEGAVIPHFDYVIRLKAEGKMLAGGIPVGDRAFVFIIEASSNDEADRIVRDMPAWGLLEWKVTPLQSVEARAEMERKVVQALKSAQR